MSKTINRAEIRSTVRQTIRDYDGVPQRDEVVSRTARDCDVPTATVESELDALEKHGFVYFVGEGDSAEVKLP